MLKLPKNMLVLPKSELVEHETNFGTLATSIEDLALADTLSNGLGIPVYPPYSTFIEGPNSSSFYIHPFLPTDIAEKTCETINTVLLATNINGIYFWIMGFEGTSEEVVYRRLKLGRTPELSETMRRLSLNPINLKPIMDKASKETEAIRTAIAKAKAIPNPSPRERLKQRLRKLSDNLGL